MAHVLRWLVAAVALAGAAGVLVLLRGGQTEQRPATPVDWQGMLAEVSYEAGEPPSDRWRLALPGDHGAHPGSRAETWTVAAHLSGPDGEEVGIQLALLRVRLVPPGAGPRESAWEPRAIYRAHGTLLRGASGRADGEERLQRDLPGVAGHDAAGREVRLDDWSIRYGQGGDAAGVRLDATVGDTAIALALTPVKDAIALAEGAGAPFRGYAITRMAAEGFVGQGEERQAVGGLAWLEHLWGDVPLPLGPVVWDRLQLHLDDGTDLSLTRTRRRDGGGTATVAGFAVGPDGSLDRLEDAAVEMLPTRTWRGAAGARYPVDWRLRAGGLRLEVAPRVDDQLHPFAAPLWSGTVAAEGSRAGEPVSARGTMLLTAAAP